MSMRDESRFGSLGYACCAAVALVALAGCSGSDGSDAGVAPIIGTQPASVTVAAGSAATFTVGATGGGLKYQWLRDGSPISGATDASYSTAATVEADDGAMFTVNVSNATGMVLSNPATLRVDWVRINAQPRSAIVEAGLGVTLSVDAVGSGTLTYQWRKDGANVAGATDSHLPLPHLAATDAGSYDCVITGQLDTTMVQVTSAVATIQLNVAPTITANPVDVTAVAGTSASFSVTATGAGTLSYQWRKNGTALTGATAATLTLSNVSDADAANYDCVVSSAVGASSLSSTSTAAKLTINDPPVITTQPTSVVAAAGSSASFTVSATGSGTLSYQWRKGGSVLVTATSSTLTLASVSPTDAGSYDCIVSNTLNGTVASTTSSAATLTVNTAPVITSQPANVTVAAGGNASFTVAATASGTLSYQWRKNGTAISGATSSTLSLTNVSTTDAGSYDCVVTNTVGGNMTSTTSSAATLTVVVTPTTPVVTIAAQATAGKTGLLATTQDQGAGNTYTWTLTNGTITGGQGTRSITYTAGTVGTLTASVTVVNLAGMASGSANETLIAPAPTPDLLCPSTVHPNDSWMRATVTQSAGTTYSWSIVAGTATATITSGQSTTTIGFSAGSSTGSFQVQVNANNAIGDPTTASCTVQVQTGVWVIKDGGPTNAFGSQPAIAALPNGRVLVSGGQVGGSTIVANAMIYSPATGTWFATKPMNTPRFAHTATVLPDGTVLVAGGRTTGSANLNTAEIFDPVAGTWTPVASTMSSARFQHTATWLAAQGKVLVAGGGSSATNALATADLYDPVAKTFTATGAMNIPRCEQTATVLQNGQVLIAGGQGGTGLVTVNTNAQSTLEIYDPLAGAFTQVTNLLQKARYYHGASLLGDGTVLITGGTSTATTFVTAEIFNLNGGPATATTAPTTNNLATGRSEHSSTTLADGRVLLVGGTGSGGAAGIYPQMTAEIYDPAGGTFTSTGGMSNGRYLHAVALLPGGQVMVAGGTAPSITSTNSVEVYDPTSATFSLAGGQVIGRQTHTTTVLSDGRVLVVGGQGAGPGTAAMPAQYLRSAQIYDPATHAWSNTGSLTTGRFDHTATLLGSGRVLVTGGMTASATGAVTTNSAEIWDPTTGLWTPVASMTANAKGRRSHTATLLPNGTVLVAGGQDAPSPANYLSSAEIYDPVANAWSAPTGTQPAMSSVRFFHTATLVGGKVVIIGGKTASTAVTSSVDSYDPMTQSFTPLTDIGGAGTTPRGSHTATLLANGKIFVAGGQIAGGISGVVGTNTTELYDPSTGTSAAMTPTMSMVRSGHTAALLANGKVLLTGGGSGASDLYDPAATTITTTGTMIVSRSSSSAVVLTDGSVMVAGGNSADANTEFFLP
jgi:N-acetylneuraminic acid mutarotase